MKYNEPELGDYVHLDKDIHIYKVIYINVRNNGSTHCRVQHVGKMKNSHRFDVFDIVWTETDGDRILSKKESILHNLKQ
jgi:hypothetical protein